MKAYTLDIIKKNRVIAVIRLNESRKILKIVEALMKGGIKCLEITYTVPDALKIIKEISENIGQDFKVGAGTVLNSEIARAAIYAGAEFIVAPNTNYKVINVCKKYDKVIIPGAFTPTEIFNAWEKGADIVKVFPARYFGPKYFVDIKGPYPQINLMPTGGVSIENAADFIRSGAYAVSIGRDLLNNDAIEKDKFDIITENAKRLVEKINEVKEVKNENNSII